ncbi:MAG: cytochrome c family protein [Desulfovibrio sp.]|jgi:hypothetical protein|nr:cytochrome c family protein [Desulfovibrio sp.]
MKNQSSSLLRAGMFCLAFLVLAVFGHNADAGTGIEEAKTDKRADVIVIDAMARHGKLEMPPAVFLHDTHTKALADAKKDCSSCHQPAKPGDPATYSFRFMDPDKVNSAKLKEFYHGNCIGCHADMSKNGSASGPLEAQCRDCHNPEPAVRSNRQSIALDKVLHYKHIASTRINFSRDAKHNCGACHHAYDSASGQLLWAKGNEDSCRACHLLPNVLAAKLTAAEAGSPGASDALADTNGPLKKRPTLEKAAHHACVNCHMNLSRENNAGVKTGPFACAGCHSPEAQKTLADEGINNTRVAAGIPRLERGQPDAALMTATPEETNNLKSSMKPVSFNHELHELSAKDCRSCHHRQIGPCSSCHSLEGKREGGFVTQAGAMHAVSSGRSCVGCHAAETQKPSCAGCHTVPLRHVPQSACESCHSQPVGVSPTDAENASLLQLDKQSQTALAKATATRRGNMGISAMPAFHAASLPEKIRIGILSKDYEPAEFPHRAIVSTLLKKQEGRLAAVFHAGNNTVCRGCHHNSPASNTPPGCVSCHGTNVVTAINGTPPLAAAYHKQCMGCHASMAQKPAQDDCAGCHKPRGKK